MRNLMPWFEPPNETWNNQFNVTQYSYLMEDARIGSSPNFDVHNWYGRAASKLFKAVSVVYSNDRTLYNTVIGIQLYSGALGVTLRRFNSDRYVSETGQAGDAAKLWATHFAPAAYVQSGYYGTATETSMATEWASASAARKIELEDQYMSYEDDAANALAWDGVKIQIDTWTTYGASIGLTQTQYEGNFETNGPGATGDLGNFRNAAKRSTRTYWLTQRHLAYFASKGIVYPSLFDFCGQGTWSALTPSIYDSGSHIWDAWVDWDLGKRCFKAVAS